MARPRKTGTQHLPRYMHEKHGAFYLVRDGKWTRLAGNVADALAEFARWMGGTSTGGASVAVATPTGTPMPELIDRALPVICHGLSPNTQKVYRSKANKLREVFAAINAPQLRAKHVYDMRRELVDSPSTFNLLLTVLRGVMQWAVEQEIVESNPCGDIDPLSTNKRDRYVTDAEYAAIHAKAPEHVRIIMALCYHTGQRINDVLHIQHDDLLTDGVQFKQQKTGKKIVVAWTPELRDAVARAKARDKNNVVKIGKPRFLLSGRGGDVLKYNTINDQWRAAVKAAGLADVNLHDLRARAATDIDRDHGRDKARALMGHRNAGMTERYIRDRRATVVQGPTARVKVAK